MEKKFFKTKEVAAIFGVDMGTIQTWCREGKLKGIKIGRDWYIPKSEIERMLGTKIDSE